ncbi:hypothetical protein CAPTEDRAFT_122685 [Capitella teleta]|uniref:Uncharacterized protein n=1 Tax=Capitella teleta TaxID=283909 RepID=R7V7E3_CAPTE|nr:hypothetical protein CAPTEDRAFT_122685 [Capitella teleta]|eukprot:ELU14392.1 hypothetical protein CAPTEDRAFT_122685 [Capitella teleta]
MTFNASKSQVLHLGSKNPNLPYTTNQVSIDDAAVVRDLGVLMDNQLKLHLHAVHWPTRSTRSADLLIILTRTLLFGFLSFSPLLPIVCQYRYIPEV